MQETATSSSVTAASKPPTPRSRYFVIAALGIGTVYVLAIAAPMLSEPRIVVEGGSAYQAGVISSRRLLHDFVIYNPHPYSVTVEASSEGCACTTTRLDKTTLGPFRRMPIHVKIDAEDDGRQTEGAKITTSHAGRTAQAWLFVSYDKKQEQNAGERFAK